MDKQTMLDLIQQSMQDSVVLVRCLTGRMPSPVTREEALAQVKMLEEAKQKALAQQQSQTLGK